MSRTYTTCGGRGYSKRKHLLKETHRSEFAGAFRYVMECGEEVVSADPPEAHEDWEFCKRCAKTERGKKWIRRHRGQEEDDE